MSGKETVTLLHNKNVTIWYHPDKKMVHHQFHQFVHGEVFREALNIGAEAIRELLGHGVAMFGICLGHQLLGRALGAGTVKLPFGHHGGNHPVRRLADGRVEITAQNHGFAVDLWSLTDASPAPGSGLPGAELLPGPIETPFGTVIPSHQNLNDGTLEGLERAWRVFDAITEPIDGMSADAPVFEDPASHGYYREEGGGMMVGLFEPVAAAWPLTVVM